MAVVTLSQLAHGRCPCGNMFSVRAWPVSARVAILNRDVEICGECHGRLAYHPIVHASIDRPQPADG